MPDQIVITEKSSQAKDVGAAVGSRYGDILPAEVGAIYEPSLPNDRDWSAFRSMRYAGRGIRQSGSLEAALKCRSCRKGRYAPPVHMIKLTETREITPYPWVHPDEER
jgi:hypothetical protein